jgi:hypothetical protein
MSLPIDLSKPGSEGALQVSKSRKLPLLIDINEMEDLFASLGEVYLFDGSRPVSSEEMVVPIEIFLKAYASYIEGIKRGELVDERPLRPYFSAMLTLSPRLLYAMPLAGGKYLVKPRLPIIQLQRHHFLYTDRFHSGVMGEGSITWGIQFSYPHLYLDPKTQAIGKVEKNGAFPNTELFSRLAKWVRANTIPTPFIVKGMQQNQPMRLGKHCLEWVNHHPTLKQKELYVARKTDPSVSD